MANLAAIPRDNTAAAMDAQLGQQVQKRSVPPPPTASAPARPTSLLAKSPEVTVQGGSLKTWAFSSPSVERVMCVLKTEGRPLDADVELWAGPDNTPHKIRVYIENGATRPFSCVMETPRGPNTIAVRNIGQLEFPLFSQIEAVSANGPLGGEISAEPLSAPIVIQGGALRTFPFDPSVESVQVLLKTDGRPLNARIELLQGPNNNKQVIELYTEDGLAAHSNARIELLQGPNNNKQVIELYTEDGLDRPFYAILESPGSGNVIRIVNTATVEFPMTASVGAFKLGTQASFEEIKPVISGFGDSGYGSSQADRENFKYGPPPQF
eukprot:CAMPEP_0194227898 /NCGR_PEP_ID=MMETSP0156-20130528/43092_1 /TAXON_ID=33649 /ORGANISM="Thalassionema nitzschioides, Strain L26-B" /LENGTH=323 /DNA_ID=CAMNT_0038960395 /DNA_START=45 /DNA_END=1017 /DNA_ORIENTATION=+